MGDYIVAGRGKMREERERELTKHKKKNKCESPKAATTEGTINCYMEADACGLRRYYK